MKPVYLMVFKIKRKATGPWNIGQSVSDTCIYLEVKHMVILTIFSSMMCKDHMASKIYGKVTGRWNTGTLTYFYHMVKHRTILTHQYCYDVHTLQDFEDIRQSHDHEKLHTDLHLSWECIGLHWQVKKYVNTLCGLEDMFLNIRSQQFILRGQMSDHMV